MDTTKIEKNGRIFMLAYDGPLEHGPMKDLIGNDQNHDPAFIIETGIAAGASCVAMHYGLAKQAYKREYREKLPLILKLNGKTNLYKENYRSAMTGNVEDAIKLGAVGIGMTINPGQKNEHIQFDQFAEVRREAEKAGLITILWSYARGPEIPDQYSTEVVAYAARVATELGADAVKVKYTGSGESFKQVVRAAVNTRVLASGTENFNGEYTKALEDMLTSGAVGVAVGRNVWQKPDPITAAKQIANVIYQS